MAVRSFAYTLCISNYFELCNDFVGNDEWMDTLLSCLPASMVVPSDSIKIIKMIGQGIYPPPPHCVFVDVVTVFKFHLYLLL